MLHIIVLILKILGFVLLGAAGFSLFLLVFVVLCPFSYRLDAAGENDLEHMNGKLRFSWLFHLLTGHIVWDGKKVLWQIRIGWKHFKSSREEQEFSSKVAKKKRASSRKQAESILDLDVEKAGEKPSSTGRGSDLYKQNEENAEQSRKKGYTNEKKIRLWEKIKYTFEKICDNMKSLKKKKQKLISFVENEVHRNAFFKTIRQMIRFLEKCSPQKADIWIQYGFEDPSWTGYTLALFSLFYPSIGEHTRLQPDFENKVLRGRAFVQGSLCLFSVLSPVLVLLLDKNVRITYRHVRRFKL